MLNVLSPTDKSIYAREADNLASYGIDWMDIANLNTACQLRALRVSASRIDLEIIHFLWVRNAGNENGAAASVKTSLGEESYRSAVEAYGGAAFDCGIETRRRVDHLKAY